MSLSSPWQAPENLTAFERAARQIAEEERRLRVVAESQLREYVRLVVEFAGLLLADELDQRTRADPHFVSRATPETWRSLLQGVRQGAASRSRGAHGRLASGNGDGWTTEAPPAEASDHWHVEAEHLQTEVARLQAENRLLRALVRPAHEPATAAPAEPEMAAGARVGEVDQLTSGETRQRAESADRPVATAPAAVDAPTGRTAVVPILGLADVHLPPLPAVAPGRFADQLQTWPRQALALAALGITGWSMRLAIADLMSANLSTVKADAGSLRRAFQVLARRQFWIEQKVTVAGVHKPDLAEADDTTLILVRLAPLGHEVLRACGIAPVPSEWDLLLASHGGAAQTAHAGLVCAFTYHARLRGWATAVCPPADGPSQPDVLLRRDGADLCVEVEGESGEAERRMVKWQRQIERQGRVAVAAVTAEMRLRLVAEAQAAGAEHGLATDLQTLFDTQKSRGPLWASEW
jgi:hypothetical protein